ncbi:MAG TPA: Zn-ribbon domain-containing OB-fold protein [Nitrososphaerales archaeon]|nr:Zn-ribbon domain-containing OB-fold protein [Nitrososphaerales archaeon]
MSAVVDARTGRITAWTDGIPLHYEYTAGTAGEVFLRGLMEARIVASKCRNCGEVRLPPRAYCLECFGRTRVDVELLHFGIIASLSTTSVGPGGAKVTFGFVTFEGAKGGLLHKILHEGRSDPRIGDPVRPLFAPAEKRRGSILDLEGFRTSARRRGGKR